MSMRFKLIMLVMILLVAPLGYAGGGGKLVKITNVQSLSDKVHLITLSRVDSNETSGYVSELMPQDCKTMTWKIDYNDISPFKRFIRNILSLLQFHHDIKALNQHIEYLKNHLNHNFYMIDIEAFYPIGQCELLSENLEFYASDKREVLKEIHPKRHSNIPQQALIYHSHSSQ